MTGSTPGAPGSWTRERPRSLAAQMVFLSAARLFGFATAFAIPLVLVRTFDQAQFGIYKQVFLIVGSLVPILGLGLNASLYYFIPQDKGEGTRFIVQATGLTTLAAVLAALALWLYPGLLGGMFDGSTGLELAPVIALLLVVSVPAEIAATLPVVDRRPVLAAAVVTGSEIVRALSLVGAAVLVGTVRAVVWATILSTVLRVGFLGVYVLARRTAASPAWSSADVSRQLRYSLPFALAVVFEIAFFRFHEYFVAGRVSDAEFAIYAVGIFQLPLLGILVQSVAEVLLVRMSESHGVKNHGEMRRVWYLATGRLGLVLVPIWMFAELSAPVLIEVLFGAQYLPAVPTFRVFSMSILLYVIVDHTVLRATGDTPMIVRANIFALVCCIATTLLVSRVAGPLTGAVTGYLTGLAIARVVGLARVRQRLDVAWRATLPWAVLMKVVAVSAVATGLASLAFLSPIRPLPQLLAGAAIFSLAYAALAAAFGMVPPEIMRRVSWRPAS